MVRPRETGAAKGSSPERSATATEGTCATPRAKGVRDTRSAGVRPGPDGRGRAGTPRAGRARCAPTVSAGGRGSWAETPPGPALPAARPEAEVAPQLTSGRAAVARTVRRLRPRGWGGRGPPGGGRRAPPRSLRGLGRGGGRGPGRRHSPAAPWSRGPASVPAAGGRRLPGGAAASSSRRAPPRWCPSGSEGPRCLRGRRPRPPARLCPPRATLQPRSGSRAGVGGGDRLTAGPSYTETQTNERRVRLGGRRGPAARARRLQARPLASAFFCLVQGPSTMTVSEIRPACSP